jgi:hypothetical protein
VDTIRFARDCQAKSAKKLLSKTMEALGASFHNLDEKPT